MIILAKFTKIIFLRIEVDLNGKRNVAMGEERAVYRVLVGKPEGKRPLGRPRLRWDDNIEVGFNVCCTVYRCDNGRIRTN